MEQWRRAAGEVGGGDEGNMIIWEQMMAEVDTWEEVALSSFWSAWNKVYFYFQAGPTKMKV